MAAPQRARAPQRAMAAARPRTPAKFGRCAPRGTRTNPKASSSPKVDNIDLDWAPILSWRDHATVLVGAASSGLAMAFLAFRGRRPAVGVFVGAVVGIATRYFLIETKHQRALVEGPELGDSNSSFDEVGGIVVHYKVEDPPRTKGGVGRAPSAVLHASHGFGANCYSWEGIQGKLSEELDCRVVCHDTPGFGLTPRPKEIRDFTLLRNAEVSLDLVDLVTEDLNDKGGLILMGHSMGCISAAHAALQRAEQTRALVLVAPAIRAVTGSGAAGPGWPVTRARGAIASKIVYAVIRPFLLVLLRALVRSKAFWQRGLGAAFSDKTKVSEETVDGYRRAKMVKRWDVGMIKFVVAQIFGGGTRGLVEGIASLSRRGVKVVIIHGEDDRIVPCSNSRRLAEIIPGCELKVLPRCGHNPQEEAQEAFVRELKRWYAAEA